MCIQETKQRCEKEKVLLEQITNVEKKLIENESKSLFTEYENLNSELRRMRFTFNEMRVRAIKGFYLDVNEGNPKSLKNLTTSTRGSNKIKRLKTEEGVEITEQTEILNEFHKWYQKHSRDPNLSETDENRLIKEQNDYVETHLAFPQLSQKEDQEITEYEVRKSIEKLNKNSAPGPDGLTSSLYKENIDFFAPLLVQIFNSMIDSGKIPYSFRLAIIKLIPKKSESLDIGEFRPISLINTDQKILSHILAYRIKTSVSEIIDSHQTAHLPNRSIHSSLLKIRKMAYEVTIEKCLLTIDFSKAFDRIYRTFFMKIVEKLDICSYTKKCSYMIEIDGFISPPIQITRGVRQGCPVSALLFNLG